jgi:hypothetical protein
MKNKVLFVAGVATGYVVGARAGRSAYTALAEKVRTARSSDAVQSAVGRVKAVAEERLPGLTSAVSTVTDTTASLAEAAASAPDPEGDSGGDTRGSSADRSSTPEAEAPAQKPAPKRSSRSRSSSSTSAVPGPDETGGSGAESAEEAAKVFEEQLPESGGATHYTASSIATDGGAADESETPTATS